VPSRLGGVGLAAGATLAALGAAGERGAVRSPLTRQRHDGPPRDVADLGRPLGRLGHTVALAQHVGLELVEAVRALGHVLLVVGALLQPHVGDGQRQRRGGAGPVGDPLLAHMRRGVVVEGIDEDGLDALVTQPQPPHGGVGTAVDAVGGVGVVAPGDQEFGVAERVLEQVIMLGVAQPPVEAVGVSGTPVPALPAVRVVEDVGEADEVEEARPRARAIAQVSPVVVRGGPGHDGLGTVLGADALHLAGDQVQSLVPADAYIRRLAAVLRVPLPIGIEVDPLHGVEDALLGIHPGPFYQRERRHTGFAVRRVFLAVDVESPRGCVRLVKDERTHPGDLPIFYVHSDRPPAGAVHEGLF